MSKKNNGNKPKKTIPAAPAVENTEKKVETKKEKKVNTAAEERAKTAAAQVAVVDPHNPLAPSTEVQANGLDPNHQVDLMNLTKEYYKDSPDLIKKFNVSTEVVDTMNHLNMIAIAAAWANEMTFSKTPFAAKLRTTMLPEMASALKDLGINAEKILSLPPASDGTVTVKSSDVKIPAEVKKDMKAENDIQNSTVELDPTKIENKVGLVKAVQYYLTNKSTIYPNIHNVIEFYRSWLKIQHESDEKAITRINSMSAKELLSEIVKLAGMTPWVLKGFGGYLLRLAISQKSPVVAFCAMRNTAVVKKTGLTFAPDQEIADVVQVLIDWAGKSKISEKEKNLEVLKKDTDKNKDAITLTEQQIAEIKDVLKLCETPTSDFADNLLENLKSTNANVAKNAKEAFGIIAKTYYPKIDLRKKYANLADNVQQYAGIITNLFLEPLQALQNYSEANLTELVEAPAEKTEEKPAEEKKEETKQEDSTKEEKVDGDAKKN